MQIAMWPCVISKGGITATVIRTPDRVTEEMDGNNYVKRTETVIDMLRSDFVNLNMKVNEKFTVTISDVEQPYRFSEIIGDDESEPTVQIRATRQIGTL